MINVIKLFFSVLCFTLLFYFVLSFLGGIEYSEILPTAIFMAVFINIPFMILLV